MKNLVFSRRAARALSLLVAMSGSASFAQQAPSTPPGTPVTNVVPDTTTAPRTIDAAQTKALASALKSKNWDAARIAVTSGADVNITDKSGITPLMRACDAGQAELVELLLQNGANPNALDKKGQNALHYAVPGDPKPKKFGVGNVLGALGGGGGALGALGGGGDIASLLGAGGLNNLLGANLTSLLGARAFNLSGKSGWMAIAGAAIQGDAAGKLGVGQLLTGALNGNTGLDAGGWTNLLSAVKLSNPQVLGAMSKIGGGNIGADKAALWGQFLNAASSGNQSGVEGLMKNPNLLPLLKQATNGLSEATGELPGNAPRTIIGVLLESGAIANTPDGKGKTPLALAQERGVADVFPTN